MPLKEGDPVTVALRWQHDSPELLSRTEITHVTPFFSELPPASPGFMANDDDRNVHYLVDEGITWVRGHVADDSPEGKALIAAHALAPKATEPFATGGMTPMTTSAFPGHEALSQSRDQKNELGE
jgi:hypothetical protein